MGHYICEVSKRDRWENRIYRTETQMRYQQMFASLTVREKIDKGITSGIIWHTQGSGKTALAYNLTKVLSDYFSKNNKVAKFYFIVDRLDLFYTLKMYVLFRN